MDFILRVPAQGQHVMLVPNEGPAVKDMWDKMIGIKKRGSEEPSSVKPNQTIVSDVPKSEMVKEDNQTVRVAKLGQ